MKASGDLQPNAYSIEAIPKRPGYVLIRLFENAQATAGGWQYDEYHLELPDRPGLNQDVAGSTAGYLAQAKAQEERQEAAKDPHGRAEAKTDREAIEQEVTDSYLDIIEAQQSITELYLMIIGG